MVKKPGHTMHQTGMWSSSTRTNKIAPQVNSVAIGMMMGRVIGLPAVAHFAHVKGYAPV